MGSQTGEQSTRFDGSYPAIEFDELSKRYRNGALALDRLTLAVKSGEIFGFLGPNGAGKTTTIRLMLDLIRPTTGTVRIFGQKCNSGPSAIRARIGYLPGELSIYEGMTVRAVIDLFGSLRPGSIRKDWFGELCSRLDLRSEARVGELSTGNRQKVGIVLALIAEPELLILDEPTSGLDPLAQREVLRILREIRDRGSTIFFSSHNLPEVESICDRVAMIRRGELVAISQVDEIVSKRLSEITVVFADSVDDQAFSGLGGIREIDRSLDGTQIRFEALGEIDGLVKHLALHRVLSIESTPSSLEEAFMTFYSESDVGPRRADD